MNDKWLDSLLRMAVEVDQLESRAAGQPPYAAGRIDRAPQPLRLRRQVAAAAVAACLALLLVHTPSSDSVAPAIALRIDHCPSTALVGGERTDRFEPSASEHCVVLALFRTYQEECRCLTWRVHEWEDGRPLAELNPDRVLEIALDVTDAPPIEQLLVVAAARLPADLPADFEQAAELLECLNEMFPPTECQADESAYASAVRACLGDSVTIVPQSFFVE